MKCIFWCAGHKIVIRAFAQTTKIHIFVADFCREFFFTVFDFFRQKSATKFLPFFIFDKNRFWPGFLSKMKKMKKMKRLFWSRSAQSNFCRNRFLSISVFFIFPDKNPTDKNWSAQTLYLRFDKFLMLRVDAICFLASKHIFPCIGRNFFINLSAVRPNCPALRASAGVRTSVLCTFPRQNPFRRVSRSQPVSNQRRYTAIQVALRQLHERSGKQKDIPCFLILIVISRVSM